MRLKRNSDPGNMEKSGQVQGGVEKKLASLGLTVPLAPPPVATYVPAVQVGDFVITSGQIPFSEGELRYQGKVGKDLTLEEGYQAARLAVLNCLGAIKSVVGSLDQVERVVRLAGYVNSAPDFTQQSQVVNGASDLLGEIFGPQGHHARVAIGASELPINAAVEIELVVKLKSE